MSSCKKGYGCIKILDDIDVLLKPLDPKESALVSPFPLHILHKIVLSDSPFFYFCKMVARKRSPSSPVMRQYQPFICLVFVDSCGCVYVSKSNVTLFWRIFSISSITGSTTLLNVFDFSPPGSQSANIYSFRVVVNVPDVTDTVSKVHKVFLSWPSMQELTKNENNSLLLGNLPSNPKFLLVLYFSLGWLSIDAVWGRTAGLKNGVRFPRTIL